MKSRRRGTRDHASGFYAFTLPFLLHGWGMGVVVVGGAESRAADSVKVFGLQDDIWAAPRTDIELRYNMSQKGLVGETSEASVCFRVRPSTLTDYEVHFSMAESDVNNNVLLISREAGVNGLYYNGNRQYGFPNFTTGVTLHQWVHYCHVFSSGVYVAFVDGVEAVRGPIKTQRIPLPLNGTLVLGQEQDLLAGGYDVLQIFRGHMADIDIWDRSLTQDEVKDMALCEANSYGNLFSSDRDEVELLGATMEYENLASLCTKTDEFMIFPEMRYLDESRQVCQRSGYEVFGPRNNEANDKLYKESLQFTKSCSSNYHLWLGLTDEEEEGVWRTFLGHSIINETSFEGIEPNGERGENCILMFRPTGLWVDTKCSLAWPACTPCEKKEGVPLRLRGLCHEKEEEGYYEVLGYRNGKPYFHGFYGNMIYRTRNGNWELFDTRINLTIATMTPQSEKVYPIGRHHWNVTSSVCDFPKASEIEMSLSVCRDEEFTCANGDCIPQRGRCNDQDDCIDFSDEDDCTLLQTPLGYRIGRPPSGDMAGKELELQSTVSILRFVKVDDVSGVVSMEVNVEMVWKDLRLKYLNLKEFTEWNILTEREISQIWRPKLAFLNVFDGNVKLLKEELFFRKISEPLSPDFNDVRMDMVYSGDAASIIQRQHYSGSFSCHLNVFRYPFDTQECSLMLRVAVRRDLVRFSPNRSFVHNQEENELPDYEVGKPWVSATQRGSNQTAYSVLEVKFQLTRRWTTIILSLYVPTTMLLMIGYATLFVKFEILQVRLVVSLTTLLVLYTLFNNTSEALPATAYVKMVDLWFFFSIFVLFFIIILHVAVEYVPTTPPTVTKVFPANGASLQVPKNPKPSWESVRSPEGVLKITRKYVMPIAMVVFNLAYWLVIFS